MDLSHGGHLTHVMRSTSRARLHGRLRSEAGDRAIDYDAMAARARAPAGLILWGEAYLASRFLAIG